MIKPFGGLTGGSGLLGCRRLVVTAKPPALKDERVDGD